MKKDEMAIIENPRWVVCNRSDHCPGHCNHKIIHLEEAICQAGNKCFSADIHCRCQPVS